MLVASVNVSAQTSFEADNIKYKVNADNATVTIVGTSLKNGSITLPSSVVYDGKEYVVVEIGDFAFYSLTYLNINSQLPSHLKKIGQGASGKCSKLGRNLVLPVSLETIGERAFCYSGIGGTLVLPDSLKRLDEACFLGCNNIETIEFRAKSIPDGGVRQYVFNEIYQNTIGGSVTKLVIGNNVERIPASMFRSLYQFSLTFEKGSRCKEIGSSAFSSDNPGVFGPVELPASVRTIGPSAFKNCSKMTGLTFAGNDEAQLETIGDNAFDNCTNMAGSLSLPSTVKSIGREAFNNCKLSGTLILPDSLKYLGYYAFRSCSGISSIDYRAVSLPDEGVVYEPFSDVLAGGRDTVFFKVAETVERIPKSLCSSLHCYTLAFEKESRCKEIGSDAFACNGNRGVVGDVSLPDGLRVIGNNAFSRNKELLRISFPEGLEQIGNRSFSECANMKGSLDFSASLVGIGDAAFEKCGALDGRLVLPVALTAVGKAAFSGCVRISAIDFHCADFPDLKLDNGMFSTVGDSTTGVPVLIGKEVRRVPNYLFISNPNVNKVVFEEGSVCEAIGDYALAASSDMADERGFVLQGALELPASLRTIGRHAFSDHRKLTSVYLSSTIESIGGEAFGGCEGVTELYFGPADCVFEQGKEPSSSSFKDMGKATGGLHLTIGREVPKIEPYQFSEANLTSLVFEEGSVCKDIADEAFKVASLKGALVLPAGLRNIGEKAFYGTSLASVVIPESVSKIGCDAFSNCKQLSSVHYNAVEARLSSPEYGGAFCMAGISVGGYALAIGGKTRVLVNNLFENGVLRESKLEKGGGIRSLSFAENCILDSIGENAFIGNALLAGDLVFPASVRGVGACAFSDCGKLSSVNVPTTVKYIGDEVFSGCKGMKEAYYDVVAGQGRYVFPREEENGARYVLTVGPHVRSLPVDFCTDAAIDSISIGQAINLQTIGDGAFSGCNKMRGHNALAFLDGIKSIGSYAFNGCKALMGRLNLPASLEKLGDGSLSGITVTSLSYNSPAITREMFRKSGVSFSGTLAIGPAIKDIPSEMFSDCTITALSFDPASKLESIGDKVFYKKLSGVELKLPETVRHIGASAFEDAGCIGDFRLPTALSTLGARAFKNCTGLTGSLDLPEKITKIPVEAFSGCKGLVGTLLIPANIDSLFYNALAGTGFDKLIIEDADVPLWSGNDFNKSGGWIVKSPSYSKRVDVMPGIGTPEGMFADVPLKEVYIGRNLNYLCDAMLDMGVTRFYYSPFNKAKTIETVTIGPGVDKLAPYQFSLCIGLKTIALPEGLKTISKGTFNNDSSLVSISIPRSVETIGSSAFNLCVSLEKALIGGESLTKAGEAVETAIEDYAFNACERLKSVVLSDNVSVIGNYAFRYCSSLAEVYCMSAVPRSVSSNAFRYVDTNVCKLYVPVGSSEAYKSALVWNDFMVEEKETNGIRQPITGEEAVELVRYDMNGRRLKAPEKGINLVKLSDGTVRKVMVK